MDALKIESITINNISYRYFNKPVAAICVAIAIIAALGIYYLYSKGILSFKAGQLSSEASMSTSGLAGNRVGGDQQRVNSIASAIGGSTKRTPTVSELSSPSGIDRYRKEVSYFFKRIDGKGTLHISFFRDEKVADLLNRIAAEMELHPSRVRVILRNRVLHPDRNIEDYLTVMMQSGTTWVVTRSSVPKPTLDRLLKESKYEFDSWDQVEVLLFSITDRIARERYDNDFSDLQGIVDFLLERKADIPAEEFEEVLKVQNALNCFESS